MNDNKQDINRIKVVLVEKKYTAKWCAQQQHKDQTIVPKWRTNSVQPGLETLLQIANIFDVDVRTLIIQSKKSSFL